MHGIGLCDDTNANMSNRVKIPHVPYHICVCSELFLCIEMPVQSFAYVCVCVRLCHIPTVRASVRLMRANMAVPLCKNFTILPHRESFVTRMRRHNSGIGQGVREVFLGDNVPTAKLKLYKDSITFSYLL